MELMEVIRNRRSVRSYANRPVSREQVLRLLEAACWAPSGNNLQPWRFAVVMEDRELLRSVSAQTAYQAWVSTAPCLIAVFLDPATESGRIRDVHMKHLQSIGSSIQNLMLAACDMGLGTCWIGEILKNSGEVKRLIGVPDQMELMAVITVGHPDAATREGRRNPVESEVLCWR